MEVNHVAALDALAQFARVFGEFDAVVFEYTAGPRYGGGGVVAVLGYFVSGSGYYEAGTCGDVERILTVAARAHNVDGAVGIQVDGCSGFKQTVAQA